MRRTASVAGLGVAVSFALAGCLGEASVSYQGTVTEGSAPGHSFDDAPNPTGAPAVVGATVELCINGCPGRTVSTDDDGRFSEISEAFGGSARDTAITVRATAPGGRTVTYETIYEDTSDPTVANPSCSPPCPPVFLNLRVGP